MSLIAYLPFDGNSNNLTAGDTTSSSVSYVDGKIGQSANMQGASVSGIPAVGVSYTIAFWLKQKTAFTGSFRKFLEQSTNRSPGFWFGSTSNFIHLRVVTDLDPSFGADTSPASITVGEWIHLTFVCESTTAGVTLKSYLNGILDNESFLAGGKVISTGSDIKLLPEDYEIDDMRVFDHALSEKEIKDNYKSLVLYEFQEENTNNSVVVDAPKIIGDTSIAFWVYVVDIDLRQTIWNNGFGGEGTINFEGTFGGDSLKFFFGPNGGNSNEFESIDSTPLLPNRWVHAVLTRDMTNQEFRWYLDGSLDNTKSFSYTTVGETTFDLTIGGGYTSQFTGSLREVKQFATVLDATEVESLYKTGLAVDNTGNMHSPYIKEGFPYLSPIAGGLVGNNDPNDGITAQSGPCSGEVTFEAAVAFAEAQGGRLPTKEELESGATTGTGCGYDGTFNWSCTKGIDDSEHWVVIGNTSGTPEIRKNTETATVRYVRDDDLNRPDPTYISDSVIQNQLGINASKIQREATKQNSFSEVGFAEQMVSWLPLKNDVRDRVSNEFATVVGDAKPAADGYEFDVDDWIETDLTSTDVLCDPSNQFSICARFNYTGTIETNEIKTVFGASGGYGGSATFAVGVDSSQNIRIVLRGDSSNPFFNLSSDTEYFICVTWDGVDAIAYLNDSDGVSLNAGIIEDQGLGLAIGQHRTLTPNGLYYFTGLIKNFKYFDDALTPEEVAQEYNSSLKASINKNTAFAKEFIEV